MRIAEFKGREKLTLARDRLLAAISEAITGHVGGCTVTPNPEKKVDMREMAGLTLAFAGLVTAPIGFVWPAWWAAAVVGVVAGVWLFFSGRLVRRARDLAEYPDRGLDGAPGPLAARARRADAEPESADSDAGGD